MKISGLFFLLFLGSFCSAQTFAVIGDYGNGSENEAAVASLVDSWNPDFIVTVGDNQYPNVNTGLIDDQVGQFYSNYIFPYLGNYGSTATENRFWPAIGNHEYFVPNAQDYFDYFTLPGNERYYDVIEGNTHFFMLNSNDGEGQEPDGIDANSIQAQWLQEGLSNSTALWKIVVLHHSPYSSGIHGTDEELQWPFAEWGASAVLSGHDHHYERSSVDCIPYIVNGLGGGALHQLPNGSVNTQSIHAGEYGAMRVIADDEVMTFEFWTADNELIDSYSIYSANNDSRIFKCPEVLSDEISSDVALMDVNTDCFKDVLYTNGDHLYRITYNGGTDFSDPQIIDTQLSGGKVLGAADVNVDGNLDVLVYFASDAKFCWKLISEFGEITGEITVSNSEYASDIHDQFLNKAIIDLDNDGFSDLIWFETITCSFRWNQNNGDGSFAASELLLSGDCTAANSVELFDFNGDDLLDLFTLDELGQAQVIENTGSGTFNSSPISVSSDPNLQFIHEIFTDINGDGTLDVVAVGLDQNSLSHKLIYFQNNGSFSTEILFESELAGLTDLNVADVDQNGNTEILVSSAGNDNTIMRFEFDAGSFTELPSINLESNKDYMISDIDNDSDLDFIQNPFISVFNNPLTWNENESGVSFINNEVLAEINYFIQPQDLRWNDMDLDGDLDLVVKVIHGSGIALIYYENFAPLRTFSPGDFNGDGLVGAADLTLFLSVFGSVCPCPVPECRPDLDQNGIITSVDLTEFLALFGMSF